MPVRAVVRAFSELCVTVGTVIVLFVVYLLYWTGIRAEAAVDSGINRLAEQWAAEPVEAGAQEPESESEQEAEQEAEPYRDGRPFAVMYIPRFGAGWAKPVLENTEASTLKKGLGRYPGSDRLGAKGNFAVAGHRRTHGDPFKDFPRLRPGDAVVVQDGTTWYTYRIERRPYRTLPTDTGVVAALPRPLNQDAAPFTEPGRYLTLTTCEPEWGSSHRLIAWARLDATQPVTEGKPAALRD
ncbi:class E sortase [Streptomyces gobiensis]|uniref:class E sortase n=1 Tax=Streptomyces gobiensis TaxID=2875706 RepID=UPI001E6047C9|nr:class E sortase [Streptomyces gobiensis]UGY92592.1 class E sortase [Streptomyces gobiensis]